MHPFPVPLSGPSDGCQYTLWVFSFLMMVDVLVMAVVATTTTTASITYHYLVFRI